MDYSNLFHVMRAENIFKGWAEEWSYVLSAIVRNFGGIIIDLFSNADFSTVNTGVTAVTSAAVSLTGLFLLMEMFSQITSKWFERIEDAIQLGIKLIVAKIIIENSSMIISGIYDFFRDLGKESLQEGLDSISSHITTISLPQKGGPFGIGYLVMIAILMIISLVLIVLMSMLVIEVMGIVFEIGIHQAVGPIALSTLCNSTFRSTGISFIKSYTAVCLQATVISAIFKVYAEFGSRLQMNDFGSGESSGVFDAIFNFISPILGLVVLAVTVKKSSDLTKRMLGV